MATAINIVLLVLLVAALGFGVVRPRYLARQRGGTPSWPSRPDYVPRVWMRGPLNESVWRSPMRMFWWLVLAPIIGVVVAVVFLIDHDGFGVLLLIASLLGAAQAGIYAPRALRAAREQRGSESPRR